MADLKLDYQLLESIESSLGTLQSEFANIKTQTSGYDSAMGSAAIVSAMNGFSGNERERLRATAGLRLSAELSLQPHRTALRLAYRLGDLRGGRHRVVAAGAGQVVHQLADVTLDERQPCGRLSLLTHGRGSGNLLLGQPDLNSTLLWDQFPTVGRGEAQRPGERPEDHVPDHLSATQADQLLGHPQHVRHPGRR